LIAILSHQTFASTTGFCQKFFQYHLVGLVPFFGIRAGQQGKHALLSGSIYPSYEPDLSTLWVMLPFSSHYSFTYLIKLISWTWG